MRGVPRDATTAGERPNDHRRGFITKLTMMPPQGPVAPGTVFFERMTMLYLPVEITATIGQMRPPTGYDYGATAKGLAGGGTMTLRDLGGGSVEFHVHIEL